MLSEVVLPSIFVTVTENETYMVSPPSYFFIHYLQLGRHPVAGVVTCYISTDYEDFTLKFRYGGLHEKHVVALGTVGNHPSICSRTQGNQEKPETRWPVRGAYGIITAEDFFFTWGVVTGTCVCGDRRSR